MHALKSVVVIHVCRILKIIIAYVRSENIFLFLGTKNHIQVSSNENKIILNEHSLPLIIIGNGKQLIKKNIQMNCWPLGCVCLYNLIFFLHNIVLRQNKVIKNVYCESQCIPNN